MLDDTEERNNLSSWLRILEKIVAQSANMVVITDAEQRVRWVNQTYTDITGWTLHEALGQRAGDLVRGPLTNLQVSAMVGKRLRQGLSVSGVEMVNYRKNGSSYTVSLNIEPVCDSLGHPVAYFSIQTDISDKRALEQANARLQSHLQVAQRLARLGWVEFDAESGHLQWSGEVDCILERPSDDDAPKTLQMLLGYVAPSVRSHLRQCLKMVLENGDEFDQELPITTHQGQRRWVRCRGVPERHSDGTHYASTWTIQDVTVYKELIEQRRLTNEQLQVMVDQRTLHLEEANRSLEAFSHALSHDLKKPIRHMASYAEIVHESLAAGDTRSAQDYCRKIVGAGTRMQSLIEGLLAFSRMGRRGINPSWVTMESMVKECLNEVADSFPEREFCGTGTQTLPTVWADPVLLREVWTNLIDNAFKYSHAQSPMCLHFSCTTSDNGWTLCIEDNGRGFNEAMAPQIFQMFGRAAPDETIDGDGIGLAICQRILLAHGGRIWATSQQGKGSAFFLHLPRTPSTANEKPTKKSSGPART